MVGMAKKITYGPTRGWRSAAGKKLTIVNGTGQLTLEQFTNWEIRTLPGAGEALEKTLDRINTIEEMDERFESKLNRRMQV